MCRQRAGEWALPPLRIFNIQIINIPPVGDSDLGLVTVSNLCQEVAHSMSQAPTPRPVHPSLDSGENRLITH